MSEQERLCSCGAPADSNASTCIDCWSGPNSSHVLVEGYRVEDAGMGERGRWCVPTMSRMLSLEQRVSALATALERERGQASINPTPIDRSLIERGQDQPPGTDYLGGRLPPPDPRPSGSGGEIETLCARLMAVPPSAFAPLAHEAEAALRAARARADRLQGEVDEIRLGKTGSLANVERLRESARAAANFLDSVFVPNERNDRRDGIVADLRYHIDATA